MRKRIFTIALFLFLFSAAMYAQEPKLTKLWQTDTVMKTPESVLFDAKQQVLYVANIDGKEPWAKDGKGSIGKVGADGKIISVDWVAGLNAPKGMGLYNGKLYVADVDEIVVIDVAKSAIVQHIPIAGAQGLNDISIDKNGVIYISDSQLKKVHRVENGKAAVWLDNLQGPNGVLVYNNMLYILDNGGMYRVENNKSLTKITDGMDGGSDGIENVGGNDFIVSCWAGSVWYVKADGTKVHLLDTRDQKMNSADIGYNAAKKIVYVPTFWRNSVVAYQLN